MSTGFKPETLGASITVVDSTALAALSTDGLTIGTKCFNVDVDAYFTLTVSTDAPVTDDIVLANGLSNGRWIKDAGGGGSFGSDTLVKLPNEASDEVDALELITSLVNNVPGSEESQWLIKLLLAGVQVAAYKFGANGMTIPDGSAAHPAIEFANALGAGLYRQNTDDYRFTAGGVGVFGWNSRGLLMEGFGTSFQWPNGVGIYASGNGFRALTLSGSDLLGGDVVIGPAGANATNAVNGFLGLPTCAGTPTGVPENLPAGKVQAIYDTVGKKIWVYDGGWISTAALS